MPWVRIDEHALNHVKLLALSDGAFRLWVEGLAHCQRHLTDGAISKAALRTFRYARPARVAELATGVDGADPLWSASQDGYRVHDYLQWNEDRNRVTEKREHARERMRKLRDGSHRSSRERAPNVRDTTTTSTPPVLSEPPGTRGGETEVVVHKPNGTAHRPPMQPTDYSTDEGHRAGDFCERYADLHAKHRHGARYLSKPVLDFQEALQLVRVWDDERLNKLAQAFLTTDDEWIASGTRSIARFRSRASWCDERLREAGL